LSLIGSSEISPRASLGRDDREGEEELGRDDKEEDVIPSEVEESPLTTTYLSLYLFLNTSSHPQSLFMFAIASWLGMLYTSG
jgi:hypothetical protein